MTHSGPKKELKGFLPLKVQTRGDVANAVIEKIVFQQILLFK